MNRPDPNHCCKDTEQSRSRIHAGIKNYYSTEWAVVFGIKMMGNNWSVVIVEVDGKKWQIRRHKNRIRERNKYLVLIKVSLFTALSSVLVSLPILLNQTKLNQT